MTSVMADAPFEKVTLTYSVRGAESGRDALGNPTHSVSTGTLSALFAPYRFDQLRIQPGADPHLIAGRGELVSPLTFPHGVGIGSTLSCTYNGVPCEVTIKTIIANDLIGVAFGAYFTADLRPQP